MHKWHLLDQKRPTMPPYRGRIWCYIFFKSFCKCQNCYAVFWIFRGSNPPPGCAPAWKAVFVEPSPIYYAQNLLLVSFVTRACGNIAHGALVFIVNCYCCWYSEPDAVVFPNLFTPVPFRGFMLCLRTTYISYARWRRSKNFPIFYDVIITYLTYARCNNKFYSSK